MAAKRKKPRTAAQKRATKKMIASNRRKRACRKVAGKRGGKAAHCKVMPKYPKRCKTKKYRKNRKARLKRGPTKVCKPGYRKVKTKSTRLAARSSKRKSPKRVAAGLKAARTRKRHAAKRLSPKRKSAKKRSAPKKLHGKRSHASYVRAGKKAAATRKRKYHGTITPVSHQLAAETPRRRRRGSRRKNPIANPISHRRRAYRSRQHHPFMRMNPLTGPMEIISGLFGVGSGFVIANIVDRFLATHALVVSGASVTDTPTAGQIYNSEAPLLPLWSSWTRLAAAAGIIFVPGIASRYVPAKVKPFMQLAAYGSAAYVGGKVINDAIATVGSSSPLVLQAWGPEIAAQNRLAQAGGGVPVPLLQAPAGTSATQPAGMFAGVPKNHTGGPAPKQMNGHPATLGMGDQGTTTGGCGGNCGDPGNCGCQDCTTTTVSTDPVADMNALLADQNVGPATDYNPWDPLCQGPGPCTPMIMNNSGPPQDLALPPDAGLPPFQCPPNMFEYPPGSGQCVSGGPRNPPAPPPPPGCPPGYALQADGSCKPITGNPCPPGSTQQPDGSCKPIQAAAPPPPPCPPGSVRQADGSCYTAPTGPR